MLKRQKFKQKNKQNKMTDNAIGSVGNVSPKYLCLVGLSILFFLMLSSLTLASDKSNKQLQLDKFSGVWQGVPSLSDGRKSWVRISFKNDTPYIEVLHPYGNEQLHIEKHPGRFNFPLLSKEYDQIFSYQKVGNHAWRTIIKDDLKGRGNRSRLSVSIALIENGLTVFENRYVARLAADGHFPKEKNHSRLQSDYIATQEARNDSWFGVQASYKYKVGINRRFRNITASVLDARLKLKEGSGQTRLEKFEVGIGQKTDKGWKIGYLSKPYELNRELKQTEIIQLRDLLFPIKNDIAWSEEPEGINDSGWLVFKITDSSGGTYYAHGSIAPKIIKQAKSSLGQDGADKEYEYLVPNSSLVLLDREDLAGYSKEQLRLIRNEIFARHGYMFKSEKLRRYFSEKSWYQPQYDNVSLSTLESENVRLIKLMESQR